jgi:hypothetical protein
MSALTRVDGPQTPVGASGSATDVASSVATCPAGQKVVSGGSDSFTGGIGAYASEPSNDRASWIVAVYNTSTYAGGYVQAIANCAGSGQAVAARRSVGTESAATRQQARHLVRRLRGRIAKTCGAGYVHANLSWGEKCLRRGQYCKRSGDREYHRYGFHCHTGRLR